MTLKKDDRVILTANTKFYAQMNNPVVGSKYECEGTIINTPTKQTCIVKWDNDSSNFYYVKDLTKAPETLGSYTSIW